jgi:hypothetical protein
MSGIVLYCKICGNLSNIKLVEQIFTNGLVWKSEKIGRKNSFFRLVHESCNSMDFGKFSQLIIFDTLNFESARTLSHADLESRDSVKSTVCLITGKWEGFLPPITA